MKLKEGYQQEFHALRGFLGELAHEISWETVVHAPVAYFGAKPGVVLARLWTVGPGDRCSTCVLASECRDRRLCLHLQASAPAADPPASLESSRLIRVPLGRLKLGHVAATGEEVILPDDAASSPWTLHPEWAKREGVRGAAVLPLGHHDRVLGVFAVFTRIPLTDEGQGWLRLVADHVGAALGRARAFQDRERRVGRLELEGRTLRETTTDASSGDTRVLTYDELHEAERENLARALEQCGGKVSGPGGAAELLGLKPTTLASKIRVFGLRRASARRGGRRTRPAPDPGTP